MKILLLGKNGQLGRELQYFLPSLGELIALDRHSGICGDLADLKAIALTIRNVKPNIIVNAAAYTSVDKAEVERTLASLINTQAVEVLATESITIDALLVHYSTDYLFDGRGTTPWSEIDQPAPLNYYGETKWLGEKKILESGCKHLIFRTSWVYSSFGTNFIKTILQLGKAKEQLRIIADQIGAPTSAAWLAKLSTSVIRDVYSKCDLGGLYHFVPSGETSWYEFAEFIFQEARGFGERFIVNDITPITTNDYNARAMRPLNSRLNCSKLEHVFSISRPDWRVDVASALKALLEI